MKHPIIKDLQWRHTAKKYDASRKVSADDLAVLFEAMRLSPSSINSQPWKFIVLESDEAKTRMDSTFARMHHYNQPHVFASSHIILFAYNPKYTRADFEKVLDKSIADKRLTEEKKETASAVFLFAEQNTAADGDTSSWTKAQTYIALGNTLHALARLKIDATPLEGIDTELVNKEFADELAGYQCDVALAIGYHHEEDDFNANLPKSRFELDDILTKI